MSFATQILSCVERAAEAYPGVTVVRVRVAVGAFLAVNEASLAFCLTAIAAGTVMSGAKLEIKTVQPQLQCTKCGAFALNSAQAVVCPKCGNPAALSRHAELVVEEIEIDEQDNLG